MGDKEHGRALLAVELAQQLKHAVGAFGVQVAGGFIGQQHGRVHGQGAGHGHALLLAAAQMPGHVVLPGPQAHALDQAGGARAHGGVGKAGCAQHGQHHVFERGKGANQVVVLKHKADLVAAQPGQGAVVHGGGFFAADLQGAHGGAVEQPHDVEQSALARARGPDHGAKVAALQAQVNAMQDFGLEGFAHVKSLAHALQAHHDFGLACGQGGGEGRQSFSHG